MKKTYRIYGVVEYSMQVNGKNGKINIRFENGAISGLGTVPASFTTANEEIQGIIEQSEKFKTGKIVLYKTEEVKPKEQPAPVKQEMEVIEVQSLEDAKELLKERFGVAWNVLKTKAAIMETAQKFNISFVIK